MENDYLDNANLLRELKRIEFRPGLWFREESISYLQTYVWGYGCAMAHMTPIPRQTDLFGPFGRWLAERSGDTATENCFSQLLSQEKDEARAFRRFFVEFVAFLKIAHPELHEIWLNAPTSATNSGLRKEKIHFGKPVVD